MSSEGGIEMQPRNHGPVGFAVRYGLCSFGPMFFMILLLIDETFGTESFGSNLYAKAGISLVIGFCWGLAMHRLLPLMGARTD